MTLEHDTGSISLEQLGPPDTPEVLTFLGADPVLNVYLTALALRDALARPKDEFWAARRGTRLTALLYLGGLSGAVLPSGDDLEAFARLATVLQVRVTALPKRWQIIGPRRPVLALAAAVSEAGPPRIARDQLYLSLSPADLVPVPRVPELRPARREDYALVYESGDQLYLSLSPADLPPGPAVPELRNARREDYALVYESGAALRAEELLEDPREADPVAYARRVEEDCRDGHTWLVRDARGLAFRASVSALTVDAAQVSGVYTPPERRGQGLATRGLGELCRRLFARSAQVCLFVNDFNAPALAVYERLGFRTRATWASVFYERRD